MAPFTVRSMITAIRTATLADRPAMLQLAVAQGSAAIAGEALVALSGDEVVAAIAVRDGRVVAARSRATGAALHHLRLHRTELLASRVFDFVPVAA